MVLGFIMICLGSSLESGEPRCEAKFATFEAEQLCLDANANYKAKLQENGIVVLVTGCYTMGKPV